MKYRTPPPVAFSIFAFLMYWLPPIMTLPAQPVWMSILFFISVAIAIASLWQFHHQKTSIDPIHLEKTQRLITTGIYRFSRNPMYLSLVLLLMVWALWLQSLGAFLGVLGFAFWVTEFQIKLEEHWMKAHFAQAYLDYQKQVRRWL